MVSFLESFIQQHGIFIIIGSFCGAIIYNLNYLRNKVQQKNKTNDYLVNINKSIDPTSREDISRDYNNLILYKGKLHRFSLGRNEFINDLIKRINNVDTDNSININITIKKIKNNEHNTINTHGVYELVTNDIHDIYTFK